MCVVHCGLWFCLRRRGLGVALDRVGAERCAGNELSEAQATGLVSMCWQRGWLSSYFTVQMHQTRARRSRRGIELSVGHGGPRRRACCTDSS